MKKVIAALTLGIVLGFGGALVGVRTHTNTPTQTVVVPESESESNELPPCQDSTDTGWHPAVDASGQLLPADRDYATLVCIGAS